jgi:hypothetical protein
MLPTVCRIAAKKCMVGSPRIGQASGAPWNLAVHPGHASRAAAVASRVV